MRPATLITGGTGKTGRGLAGRLKAAGWPVTVAARSPAASGEAVRFDWFDPATHDAALEGADRVYLLAPVGDNNPVVVMAPFIERAIAKGVSRFVLMSSSSIEEDGPAMGKVHGFLRRHALEWSVLRPSWFMENFTAGQHAVTIRDEGAIYSATDDGLTPFVAVDDIVEVAFRALTDDAPPEQDLVITGPEALSYGEVARLIGAASGRPVTHVRLSGEDLARRWEAFGLSADYAAMLAGLDRAIAAGAEARTTAVVADMTGREPITFAAFAERNAGVWRAQAQA